MIVDLLVSSQPSRVIVVVVRCYRRHDCRTGFRVIVVVVVSVVAAVSADSCCLLFDVPLLTDLTEDELMQAAEQHH